MLHNMAEIITAQSEKVTKFNLRVSSSWLGNSSELDYSRSTASVLSAIERMMEGLNKLSATQHKRYLCNEVFITDSDLCERLRVKDRTTQNWRSDGKIEYIQFAEQGRKVLYREADIQKFIERHFVKAWKAP